MNNYQRNLKEYRHLGNSAVCEDIHMRRVELADPEKACLALEEGLKLHWEGRMEESKQSEGPENPVEVIEVD